MVNDAPLQDNKCNSEMRIVGIDGQPFLCIFAKRNIDTGEEIRYDYGVDSLPWRKVSFAIKNFILDEIKHYININEIMNTKGHIEDCQLVYSF